VFLPIEDDVEIVGGCSYKRGRLIVKMMIEIWKII